jgi:hypothetical protein
MAEEKWWYENGGKTFAKEIGCTFIPDRLWPLLLIVLMLVHNRIILHQNTISFHLLRRYSKTRLDFNLHCNMVATTIIEPQSMNET